jgi:hypothetical protein
MADPTITVLQVRDAGGATQNAATVSQSSNLFPAHLTYGWDGSSAAHPVLVDSAGRSLVSGAAANGAAVAGNPVLIGGSDGADARSLLVDASGKLITPFSRLVSIGATFTPGATYAASQAFGATLAIAAGIGANMPYQMIGGGLVGFASSFSASATLQSHFFNAAPSTTFTDGSEPTWNSGDGSKWQGQVTTSGTTVVSGVGVIAEQIGALPQLLTTSSSGNIYVQFISVGAWTITTPGLFTLNLALRY